MDCHIDWSTSSVEHGKLRVSLEPAPEFAFMLEFDGIVDPLTHPRHEGWAGFCWPTATSSSATCASSLLKSCMSSSTKRCERLIGSLSTLARASNGRRKPKRLACQSRKLSSRQPRGRQPSATRS